MLTEGRDANTVTHVLGVRLRHPTAVRASGGPRPAPPILRVERRGAVRRGVRGRAGHPLPLHRRTRGGEAAPGRSAGSRQGGAARPRRLRHRLPACRRLPRGTAGGAGARALRRRLHAGAHPGPRRPVDHPQRRHRRRRRGPHLGAPERLPPQHHRLPPDEAPHGNQVARAGRAAQAAPLRPAQGHRAPLAGRASGVQGRHPPGAAAVPGARGHGLRAHRQRHRRPARRREAHPRHPRPLQSPRHQRRRELPHRQEDHLAHRRQTLPRGRRRVRQRLGDGTLPPAPRLVAGLAPQGAGSHTLPQRHGASA